MLLLTNTRSARGFVQGNRGSLKFVFAVAAVGLLLGMCTFNTHSLSNIMSASMMELDVKRLVNPSISSSANVFKPKARCILHIGPHKTSTTYLQTRLCQDSDKLREMGYVVPVAKACRGECQTSHFAGIAGQLRGNLDMTQQYGCSSDPLSDFKEALTSSGDANIILSSEEFDMLNDGHVQELANLLTNYQTTVVIYYRRKLGHLVSYYTQLNKFSVLTFPPLSFKEFIWRFLNDIDPAAGPFKSPIPKLNALCYTRMFDTFGRHFGRENLAIIDYNELVDAGEDPWKVLVRDVMGLERYADKRRTTNLEGGHDQDKSEKMNSSPDAFSLSVAGSFYQWRWTNPGLSAHAGPEGEELTDIRRQSGENNHTVLFLPQLNCILPLLEPLKAVLPKTCSTLESICSLWELHEKEALNRLAGEGSNLLYFKRDDGNSSKGKGNIIFGKRNETVCEVDTVALTMSTGKRQLDEVFREVAVRIEQTCSNDMIAPGSKVTPYYMQ